MKTRSLLPVLALCLLAGALAPESARAQWGFRPRGPLDQQRDMERRQLYRPNVHVARPKGADRSLAAGSVQSVNYSVMRGFVARIEVRSGMKVLQTIPVPAGSRSGRVTFKVPSGVGSIKLWAWQGQPAHQSVHGESIKYSLHP